MCKLKHEFGVVAKSLSDVFHGLRILPYCSLATLIIASKCLVIRNGKAQNLNQSPGFVSQAKNIIKNKTKNELINLPLALGLRLVLC